MRIDVLGVGFDNLTHQEAVAKAMGFLEGNKACTVVTPNPEIVEICRENPEAMAVINGADMVLADGIGVVKGAAMLKTPLKGRVPGIEFAAGLMSQLAKEGKSLYLLGGKPNVADLAGKKLQETYPELRIAGTADGYFKDNDAVAEAIASSGADVVFVCLGAPKQEFWMAQYGAATGAKLLCGLGGSLDVFAGVVQRAPVFFQKAGLEWFYRLCKEPRRIGRMMKLPLFLVHVQQEKRK
ncbi:WecB/TagA/CpsF family glycosyltransferase [Bengtsoniella intestinalis]|uniref:WecB/TagA/CpsF family glycosyltransferase n=1 Tax=Bengtsoniella intestinalis TaxID=3073143 RepID=UPI00391F0DA6